MWRRVYAGADCDVDEFLELSCISALLPARHAIISTVQFVFYSGFARLPQPQTFRSSGEWFQLLWDFSFLCSVRDVNLIVGITTPSSGRMQGDYFFDHWIWENDVKITSDRDEFIPSLTFNPIDVRHAGSYELEATITSVSAKWMRITRLYSSTLAVYGNDYLQLSTNMAKSIASLKIAVIIYHHTYKNKSQLYKMKTNAAQTARTAYFHSEVWYPKLCKV